jgi:hypothetical protein
MSIDKKVFGLSDSLVSAVNEALKGGQHKIDVAEPKGKITGADFKKLRGESAKPDFLDLDKDGNKKEPMKTAVKQAKEDVQIDELSSGVYKSAMNKAAKRAVSDVQGKSGPIHTKYAPMARKFQAKGMEQEKKEKAMKEETVNEVSDAAKKVLGAVAKKHGGKVPFTSTTYKDGKKIVTRGHNDEKGNRVVTSVKNEEVEQVDEISKKLAARYNNKVAREISKNQPAGDDAMRKRKNREAGSKLSFNKYHNYKVKVPATNEETDPGFVAEADNAVAKQIAAKKDTFKKQLQQKIAAKQMNTMQAKANKRLANIHASNDKCSCQEGKGKSMTCEVHGDNSKGIKGGKEPIEINPSMKEAAELPKKVITKGHEIAKSLIKHRSKVDNPYAVGMAAAKKSAKIKAYRADRDKNKEN